MRFARDTVERVLSLIPLIRERNGIGLQELARLSRTPADRIANELGRVMVMCGVPPYFPHDYVNFSIENGRVWVSFADHFDRPVSMTALEMLALKVACESVVPPRSRAARAVDGLLSKVERAMGAEQRKQFLNLARRVVVRPEGREVANHLRSRCAIALAERRMLIIEYSSSGREEARERSFLPYGLVEREGHWYLIGRDQGRDQVLALRLDRVRRLEDTDEPFEIEEGFRLDSWAEDTWPLDEERERALVSARGPAARWVRELAAGGTITEQSDGSVHWRPGLVSVPGLARFIVGLGPGVQALGPAPLVKEVKSLASSVLEAHGAA